MMEPTKKPQVFVVGDLSVIYLGPLKILIRWKEKRRPR